MTPFQDVKDSGKRQEFQTGGVRDPSEGKGRFDLIPPYPLRRLAQHYENGARKYADRNWEKGLPLGRFLDSALRHLADFMEGNRQEDHLAAAIWNLFGYLHTEREIREGRLPTDLHTVPWVDSTGEALSQNGTPKTQRPKGS